MLEQVKRQGACAVKEQDVAFLGIHQIATGKIIKQVLQCLALRLWQNRLLLKDQAKLVMGSHQIGCRIGEEGGKNLERFHPSAPVLALSFLSLTPPNRFTLLSLGMQPSPKVKPHWPRSS